MSQFLCGTLSVPWKKPVNEDQRAPNPPEFAQPRLSKVKGPSSLARGYKFGCVCSYMPGTTSHQRDTRHIGTKTHPNCTLSLGMTALTQTGLCKFGWVSSSLRRGNLGKRFNRTLVRTKVWRRFQCFRPATLRTQPSPKHDTNRCSH